MQNEEEEYVSYFLLNTTVCGQVYTTPWKRFLTKCNNNHYYFIEDSKIFPNLLNIRTVILCQT